MSFPDITQNIGTITETIDTTTEAPQVTNPDFDTLAPASINGQRDAQTEQNTVIGQTNTISGQINTLSGQINTAGAYIDNSLQDIEQATNFQGNYDAGTTYSKNQTVLSDGIYYFSLVDSNTGNTPSSSPTFWEVKPSNKIFGGNGVDGEVIGKNSSGNTGFNIKANGDSYFNGGKVGFNTDSPDTQVEIHRAGQNSGGFLSSGLGIRTSSSNPNQLLVIGYDEDDDHGYISASNIAVKPIILNLLGGGIGIGKGIPTTSLDVNGSVRVGQYTTGTLPSAAASGVGALAYDTTTDTLKRVNNALAWVNV